MSSALCGISVQKELAALSGTPAIIIPKINTMEKQLRTKDMCKHQWESCVIS
jgi:hypothetical protein